MADDFESRIAKHHEERKEHDLAVQNAQAHQNRSNERTDSALSRDNELGAETTSRNTGEFEYWFWTVTFHFILSLLEIDLFDLIMLRAFDFSSNHFLQSSTVI